MDKLEVVPPSDQSSVEEEYNDRMSTSSMSRLKTVDGVSGTFEVSSFSNPENIDEYLQNRSERSLSPDLHHREQIQDWLDENVWGFEDFRIFKKLFEKGVIYWLEEEGISIDIEDFKGFINKIEKKKDKVKIIELLSKFIVIDEKTIAELLPERQDHRWIGVPLGVPDSLAELLDGVEGSKVIGGINNKSQDIHWYSDIQLADGARTTPIEIYYAQIMKKLDVKREHGKLVYFDIETQSNRQFNFTDHAPQGRNVGFAKLILLGLPNLYGSKIQDEDLRLTFVKHFPYIQVKTRKINQPDLSLNNGFGPVLYYVGRKKIFGFEAKESDKVAVLDRWTGAYFREKGGQMYIAKTFPLVNEDDYKEIVEKTADEMGKKKEELTQSEISTGKFTRTKINPETVKDYSVSDYISPYNGETHRSYLKRAEKMTNVTGVIYTINRIFVSADISHLDLSWGKKIRLAEIVSELDEASVVTFAEEYGLAGLQVLLMGEEDQSWPSYILELAKTNNTSQFSEAINVFGQLVTDEDEFKDQTQRILKSEPTVEYLADSRAGSLKNLMEGFRGVVEGTQDLSIIKKNLEAKTASNFMTFKSLVNLGLVESLTDLKDSKLEIKNGSEISIEDVDIMRSIYSQNQAEVGAHDEILAHFDERVKDPATKFYIFKWQNKIQSFVAFSSKGENLFEATSFNVDPSARGYKIGEAMLEEAIAKEAEEHILYGECYANLKISAKYIETGWIAEGHFTEPGKERNTTDQLLNIFRDEKNNQEFWGKRTTSPEAIYEMDGMPEFVKVEEVGTQLGLPFYLLNEGYVLTRMFYYEPKRKFIGVFEPDFRPEQVTEIIKRQAQSEEVRELEELEEVGV